MGWVEMGRDNNWAGYFNGLGRVGRLGLNFATPNSIQLQLQQNKAFDYLNYGLELLHKHRSAI